MSLEFEVAKYAQALKFARVSGVDAEPEAQLTIPFHDFLLAVAVHGQLGSLALIREAQLDGVRPDFAAMHGGRACGWVELKAPGHSLDGSQWRGRERTQWALLAELDSLVVSDGAEAWLYATGEVVAKAPLPSADTAPWDPKPLVELLRIFVSARPATITRVSQLSSRLAPLARLLRDRISDGLASSDRDLPVKSARAAWLANVHEGASDADFASDLAQVIAYSLAIAALRGGADQDGDHYLSLGEARDALRGPNDMLAAALGPALEVNGLMDELRFEVGAIERLASAVDAQRVATSKDSRGEPWLWFYEDFLAAYDPKARKQAGVYYTPADIVGMQVRLIEHVLREKMEISLGFGDSKVVTLDPAAGSGTYPLKVLDSASAVALEQRGEAGPKQVAKTLVKNVIAFELMPGPYAVSHLRLGQRLAEMEGALTPPDDVRVYLTNTLDDPEQHQPTRGLFGDMAVLAEERARAAQVKRAQKVTVVLGNPPYARRTAASGGGWVVHPSTGAALFDDVIQPARDAGVIFSAMRSLYDDYVYFWRWALWKAFEQEQQGAAIVSFITSSSWLRGPAFLGLRRLARAHADEMWIVDLGGGGRGAIKDENVFSIQTPVAVVTLFRKGASTPVSATVKYRRIEGTGPEKLAQLRDVHAPQASDANWSELNVPADGALLPSTGNDEWDALPKLVDLFPWQQPGVNFGRSWAVSPSKDVLERRWQALLQRENSDARAEAFVTASTGRNIFTRVAGLRRLAELLPGSPHRGIVPLAYRSFDTQWTLDDPRVALLERPSLWNSRSDRQVFMATMATNAIGRGISLVGTVAVPDFHYFAGRGGKDIIPLFRDGGATEPNVTSGLLEYLSALFDTDVSAEDLAAYAFAVLSHPGYQLRFEEALRTPGLRLPIAATNEAFRTGVELGAEVLWLHTRAMRFRDDATGRGAQVPRVPGLGWAMPVTRIPANMDEVAYDPEEQSIRIADGKVAGVDPQVWDFSVSGFSVVQRWLGSRTSKGVGRAAMARYATPLDLIRPVEWEDDWNDDLLDLLRTLTRLVDLYPSQDELLTRIMDGPLVPLDELPVPTLEERSAPRG